MEGPKFTGIEGNRNNKDSYYVYFQKLVEASNMSIVSHRSQSITISAPRDALAQALMDSRFPTEGLENYEEWKIDLRNLQMGIPFDRGNFGKLYEGTYKGEDVAIKILEREDNNLERKLNELEGDFRTLNGGTYNREDVSSKILERARLMEQRVQQEVMMLATLNHPNIVRFWGACRKPKVWCIVTQYPEGGGSVRQQNRSLPVKQTVPLKLAVKQALDVAKGMAYVHGLGFVHADLNPYNILIFKDKSIKIAGFGSARIEEQTPEKGTYRWMAPEMIQHRPFTEKVDVYSFGIILWELITGMLPFQSMKAEQAAFEVVNNGVRPIIPNDCLPLLSEIMTRCWDANPEVRPPFTEVITMLENAETEITTVSKAYGYACCCM